MEGVNYSVALIVNSKCMDVLGVEVITPDVVLIRLGEKDSIESMGEVLVEPSVVSKLRKVVLKRST